MAILRASGMMHPTDSVPVPADTVTTFLLTGGSSAQAVDLPTNAAGGLVRVTPFTTAGAAFLAHMCFGSTRAAVPSSGTTNSSAPSSGVTCIPIPFQTSFQMPGDCTGYSVAAFTSGYVQVEYWKK
jgi:hypothetical protein